MNKIIVKIQNIYGKVLRILLHKKIFVLLGALALLVLFAVLSVAKGTAFMPEMRSTQMTATISIPEDNDTMSQQELYDNSNKIMEQFMKKEGRCTDENMGA